VSTSLGLYRSASARKTFQIANRVVTSLQP
jgi:hypothetical protein